MFLLKICTENFASGSSPKKFSFAENKTQKKSAVECTNLFYKIKSWY